MFSVSPQQAGILTLIIRLNYNFFFFPVSGDLFYLQHWKNRKGWLRFLSICSIVYNKTPIITCIHMLFSYDNFAQMIRAYVYNSITVRIPSFFTPTVSFNLDMTS